MDHKVSKDMISSGMIPSGEKTQADLSRTQYGSAPSPSSLMDAYKSIYEHHQKDKDGNTIPHEDEINEMAGGLAKKAAQRGMAAKAAKNRQLSLPIGKTPATGKTPAAKPTPTGGTKTTTNRTPQGNPSSVMGRVSQGLSSASKAAGRADKAIAARGGLKKMGTDYLKKNKGNIKGALLGKTAAGTATRIAGAAVVGRMTAGDDKPSGGYYYRDINFGYTPEGDTISEDLFDALKFLLTEEGYNEKTTMKVIASIDSDFINESLSEENLDEALPLLALAPMLAKGAMVAKAGLAAAKATKLGMAAVKGAKAIGVAGKAFGKGLTTAGAKGASASKITTSGGKLATGATKVSKAQKAGQIVRGAGASIKNNPMNTALTGSMLMPQGGGNPNAPAAQRTIGTGKRTAGMRTMSLDLFDLVKGKLLDEGLTEDESNDVMTTLTLEEINEVIQLDEITSKLLMKSAKAAEVARGKAAVAGNKPLAIKKLKQGQKFFAKGVEKRRAEGKMGAGYKDGV